MATEQHSRISGAADSESTTPVPCAPTTPAPDRSTEHLRARLRELIRNLRLARCALLIATQVAEAQAAGHHADIGEILRHDIGARLDADIDAAEELLACADDTMSVSDTQLKEAA